MKRRGIILVDESRLFVDSMAELIANENEIAVLKTVYSGVDAIRASLSLCPDVLVIGQLLPDVTMASLVRELWRSVKDLRFLLIVRDGHSELLKLLSDVKAVSVIKSSSSYSEFILALRSVAKGERYISVEVLNNLRSTDDVVLNRDALSSLTPREREVLYWLSNGFTNQETASAMILSEKTVKNHVSHLLKKLNITDRTKAAALAWKEGLPLIPEEFFLQQDTL